MYKRFGWDPKIRLDLTVMDEIFDIKTNSTFFVGSMHDIFGPWIPDEWIKNILNYVRYYEHSKPNHRFIFLTKFPERYKDFCFPKNCWLGATITGEEKIMERLNKWDIISSLTYNKSFISFEPLLGKVDFLIDSKIDLIIIGGLTPKSVHQKEWVVDILFIARIFKIPIFIKNNLLWPEKIQEFPK